MARCVQGRYECGTPADAGGKELESISKYMKKRALDDMLGKVREQERHLGDIEKQLLIEAAVKVTTADGGGCEAGEDDSGKAGRGAEGR